MMDVHVRLFGPQADLAGRRAVALSLPEGATCGDVRRALAEAEPALAPSLPGCWFAVNHERASDAHAVTADDEVALIGMISGG